MNRPENGLLSFWREATLPSHRGRTGCSGRTFRTAPIGTEDMFYRYIHDNLF